MKVSLALTSCMALCIMLCVTLGLAGSAFAGRTDLGAVVRRYELARTPEERVAAVRLLAECDARQTISVAERIARLDDDARVCVAAIEVLGARDEDTITERLLELAVAGGVRDVRAACAAALARRPEAVDRIQAAFRAQRIDELDRMRLVETLGGIPSLDAYALLVIAADDDDAGVRAAALRAIATHALGSAEIADVIVDALTRHHDVATVVAALDVAEDHAIERWPEIEPLVALRTQSAIAEAVVTLGEKYAYIEGMKLAAMKRAEGYAVEPDEVPREPLARTRLDVVYAFDATGSTIGQIEQVKAFITEHAGPLVMVRHDARIGIVAYRAVAKGLSRSHTEILPLTHDVDAAIQFVNGIDQRGADSQGAAVSDAVAIALDRMPWRSNARRQVYVLADGRIDDGPRAWRIARQHRAADRTQLSVWYWSRTRERKPDDLIKLAAAGGGTFTVADPAPTPVVPWPGGGAPTGR